jgi:RimJ/RimL family protein N-acetyltransferase
MIEGGKVMLTSLSTDYLPEYRRWINDPEVADFLASIGFPLSMADERQWIERMQRSGEFATHFTIVTKSGDPIGNIALMDINYQNRNAQLGIMIGEKDHWDKGYGKDAIRTLLDYAFRTLCLNRVELRLNVENERALACYERCGFKLEGRKKGHIFYKGRYCDELIMGILKQDWEKAKSKRKA